MRYIVIVLTVIVLFSEKKVKADELLTPHSMGHIIGGIGSFFLGPLPGLGLSTLTELLGNMEANNEGKTTDVDEKTVFYVNEYSKEFKIEPVRVSDDELKITKYDNTVKLTNSLEYF